MTIVYEPTADEIFDEIGAIRGSSFSEDEFMVALGINHRRMDNWIIPHRKQGAYILQTWVPVIPGDRMRDLARNVEPMTEAEYALITKVRAVLDTRHANADLEKVATATTIIDMEPMSSYPWGRHLAPD